MSDVGETSWGSWTLRRADADLDTVVAEATAVLPQQVRAPLGDLAGDYYQSLDAAAHNAPLLEQAATATVTSFLARAKASGIPVATVEDLLRKQKAGQLTFKPDPEHWLPAKLLADRLAAVDRGDDEAASRCRHDVQVEPGLPVEALVTSQEERRVPALEHVVGQKRDPRQRLLRRPKRSCGRDGDSTCDGDRESFHRR